MEHAQHHEPVAVVKVAKHIHRTRDTQSNLSLLLAPCKRTPKFRMTFENPRFPADLAGNDAREMWIAVLQKAGKTIEISQRPG